MSNDRDSAAGTSKPLEGDSISDALTADRERLAKIVNHDLREPARAMAMWAGLLESELASLEIVENARTSRADIDEMVEFSVAAAKRMEKMLTGLVDLLRIRSHGPPITASPLADLIPPVAALYPSVSVEMTTGDLTGETRVLAAERQVRLALSYLIDNAVSFGDGDLIVVRAERQPSAVRLTVRNSGQPPENADWERLCEIFQRGHTQDEGAGLGIGLALASATAERHGCKLDFASSDGWVSVAFDLILETSST